MLVRKGHGSLPLDEITKVRSVNCSIRELRDQFETNEAEITFENIRQDKRFRNLGVNGAGPGPATLTQGGFLNNKSLPSVEKNIRVEKSSDSSDSFTEDRSIGHAQSFLDRENSEHSKQNGYVRGILMRE